MNLPLTDWQFWVVTAVVLIIVAAAFRGFIPGLRKKKQTRVSLTINRDNKD